MKVVISRSYNDLETLGTLYIFDGSTVVYNCNTLELPNLGNQHDISCIPEGEYDVVKITLPEFSEPVFQVLSVPNRTGILIHRGNYATGTQIDTKGCILVGNGFSDINGDGNLDILDTVTVMTTLLNTLPDGFKLYII
jgi:Family of unknown function (DUF5675)